MTDRMAPRPLPPAARIALMLAGRPWLWRSALALAPDRWWARWPPLPLPPPEYVRFRAETMFGNGGGTLSEHDLLDYLEWCHRLGSRPR